MNNDKWAVFLDIDGTLIGNSYQISDRNKAAITNARKKGHYVFINTGRATGNIPAELSCQFYLFDGVIAGSGTYITYNDKIILDKTLNNDLLIDITEEIMQNENLWAVFEGRNRIIGLNDVPPEWNTVLRITGQENFCTTYKNEPVQVLAIGKNVPEHMYKKYGNILKIIQMKNFADCIPPDCSKANGLELILDIIGIPKENSIAIGDSENDIDMLKIAGISVAVSNASPALMSVVDEITDTNINDGVAKVIEKYLL